jgi:hypothetical protein
MLTEFGFETVEELSESRIGCIHGPVGNFEPKNGKLAWHDCQVNLPLRKNRSAFQEANKPRL